MDEPLSVLCLSTDPAVSSELVAMLARIPGFAVSARELDYQIGMVDLQDMREPQLAIVILGRDPEPGFSVIEEVHRSAPATQVLAVSPRNDSETIIKAMRAGADEFLPLPLDPNALLKVCIKVSALRGVSGGASQGEVWVAHGPKGGVGVTTLVLNLAFALRAAQRQTALVDLDVYSGDLALFMNVTPGYSLRDIASNFKRLDSVFLQGAMVRHPSGLELLPAPAPALDEAPLQLSGEQTLRILELLDATHEVTLIDTGSVPLDSTRAALGCADRIFLVTDLTLPALRACVRTLDWLRGQNIDPAEHVELVISKYANKSWEVAPGEASKTLRLPIRALIPRDDAAVYTAINSGLPLAEVRGGATVQRAIAALVSAAAASEDAGTVLKGFRRLFSGRQKESVAP
jgi:pilus assembly protein CpaE